jgi:hypothetical protein
MTSAIINSMVQIALPAAVRQALSFGEGDRWNSLSSKSASTESWPPIDPSPS